MMQMAKDGQAPFFRRSWIGDYPDPETYYACFYSKNSAPPNYTRFSNQEFDRYYEKSLTESRPEIRRTYYKAMDQIIIEESPFVALYYDQSIRLAQKNIQNIQQNALNTLDLRRVKKNGLLH
jgi:peptide/nickel transport system substrate-binding protein